MLNSSSEEGHTLSGRQYSIGIDVGTSAVKATVISNEGRTETFTSNTYPLSAPVTGYAEQDPDHWWWATGEALDLVLEAFPDISSENTIIGLTGQMHTTVLRDKNGTCLRPAILWCDTRSSVECGELAAAEPTWESITGYFPIPAFTSAHLAWLTKNEPEMMQKVATLSNPKDDIRLRFGAGWATEPSDASATNLMDNGTDEWAENLINAVGVNIKIFPKIVPSASITGVVSELPPMTKGDQLLGVPVVGGAGDQAAQAIALGVISEGALGLSIGTSGAALQALNSPREGAFRHALPNTWLALDSTHAAGLAISWWSKVANLDYESFPVDPNNNLGPIFLPYLQGGRHGGGAPGAFSNLQASHSREEVAAAVLEGVAIELVRLARDVSGGEISSQPVGVGGGAAQLPAMRKLLAAGLERPITHSSRGSAYGAAALAGSAAGWFDLNAISLQDAETVDLPDPVLVEQFSKRMEIFGDLTNQLS